MSMFITSPVGMANNNNWKQKERYRADIVLPGMTERQTLFVNAGEILLVKVKDTKQPLRKIAIQPWFLRFVYLFSLLLECI